MTTVRLSVEPVFCGPFSIGTVGLIKLVRERFNLSLGEAKALVDRCVFHGETVALVAPTEAEAALFVREVAALESPARFQVRIGTEPIEPPRHPCPLNAPGPFYTTGECLACGAPEAEAPDLLAPLTEGNYTTYFVRQPETPDEIERACEAIRVCCVSDLRYGGTDRAIIERLGNDPAACDFVLRDGQVVAHG